MQRTVLLSTFRPSVRLSVRLSNAWIVTKRNRPTHLSIYQQGAKEEPL